MRLQWILVALLLPALLLACPISGKAAPVGCQMVKIASLPIEVTPGNRVAIKGSIKGEPVEFLLSTGIHRTLFDNAVVSKFGVPIGVAQAHMLGMGGQFEAYKSSIPDLMVGDLNGGDLMLWVSTTHFLPEGFYGLIGEDFLQNADLDIDLAHGKFDLFQHYDCKTEPVYWADKFSEAPALVRNEKIIVTVQINGVTARAVLDTGSSRTAVSWSLAHRLGLETDSPGMERDGIVRGIDMRKMDLYRYRFAELDVGDEVVKNPVLSVSNLGGVWAETDVLLGADFIRSHHLFVAANQGKIYFTWNGGSIFVAPKE